MFTILSSPLFIIRLKRKSNYNGFTHLPLHSAPQLMLRCSPVPNDVLTRRLPTDSSSFEPSPLCRMPAQRRKELAIYYYNNCIYRDRKNCFLVLKIIFRIYSFSGTIPSLQDASQVKQKVSDLPLHQLDVFKYIFNSIS